MVGHGVLMSCLIWMTTVQSKKCTLILSSILLFMLVNIHFTWLVVYTFLFHIDLCVFIKKISGCSIFGITILSPNIRSHVSSVKLLQCFQYGGIVYDHELFEFGHPSSVYKETSSNFYSFSPLISIIQIYNQ